MLQQPEKEEERRDLRWFPATKEEDCRVKQDFDEEVVIMFYILWTLLKSVNGGRSPMISSANRYLANNRAVKNL
jgi:hypothetical protein